VTFIWRIGSTSSKPWTLLMTRTLSATPKPSVKTAHSNALRSSLCPRWLVGEPLTTESAIRSIVACL
jgi:hypothetical protein